MASKTENTTKSDNFVREMLDKYQSAVLGCERTSSLIKNAVSKSSHCLLLQSEDSLYLDIFCHILLKQILAKSGGDFSNRLILDSIPDIINLPHGEKVLTEDIEHIIQTAYLTPIEFDVKIYVINRGETMNEAAQNKLLKLLEEPPKSTRFIIKCNSKHALLPTVRSRSELIEIQPLSTLDVLKNLPECTTQRQKALIAATAFGRLDYSERVLTDGNFLALEDLAFEVFCDLTRSGDMPKISYKILKFKDYLEVFIFYIECILHDCAVYGNAKQRIYFVHREKEIKEISGEYVPDVVLDLLQSIMRVKLRLKSYGNVTAIVDELLFSMLEVKTKWKRL